MNPLFIVVACAVLASLVALHWYVWRRLVRDTTRPGSLVRLVATVLVVLGPVLFVGAFATGRSGLPFVVKQIVAWPGYLWGAVFLYLLLALLAERTGPPAAAAHAGTGGARARGGRGGACGARRAR